ncbi:MAG: hypothetical protein JO132_15195 [Streptosporangiaceae bacterium]|nr:hypothetical protein [Streptosporangiaceae bacterium]
MDSPGPGTRSQLNRQARRRGIPSSPPEVLERIKHAQVAREAAESELAVLVDHAVDLGIGWPEIAAQLGVTRQAARQAYQRRHRNDGSRQIGLPDSSSARMRRVKH